MKTIFNPYLPSYEYIPDGEPRVFDDRLYIYGSHDRFGGDGYCLNDYVCWSAPLADLSAWRFEGTIYKKSQHPGGAAALYAPDAVRGADGRYYLYYSAKDSYKISVAICDTPAGKYEYLGDVHAEDGHACGTLPGEWMEFDPAVLVDTDGRVWLYSGTGGKAEGPEKNQHPAVGAFVRELAPDMLTAKSEGKIIMPREKHGLRKPAFFEGSSIRKIGELYYFVYAATDLSGLHYCTSSRPDRDFVYRGRIHSTSDFGLQGYGLSNPLYPVGNSHGGLACLNGQWFIFDHRMTNRTLFSRQGVAEPVEIQADGTIQQVEATSCGLSGGTMQAAGTIPAYAACILMSQKLLGIMQNPAAIPYITQDGGDRESGPTQYVSNIRNGSIVGFRYFVDGSGVGKITVKVRGKAEGVIRIHTDLNKPPLTAVQVHSVQNGVWFDAGASISIAVKNFSLYFVYAGKGMLQMQEFSLI